MTVCGTSAAMVVQLTLVALGLSAVLTALAPWVNLLRWIGVAYLVVIAIRTWRAQPSLDLSPSTAEADFGRGLLVSMFNPKTLFFYGAFFPQFVDPARALTPQFLTLSVSFVAVAVTIDSGWALMATRLRPWLLSRGRLQQRASATLLAGAAVGLALSRLDAE